MSLTTYIHKLKDEKGISFRQLAIESKISYGNIMDIKNNRIAFPTDSILSKLSKYVGKPKEEILFDILQDDVNESYSKASLHYLSHLGANNYTIVINPNVPDPLRTQMMTFDGYGYKKRSGNTFTVVDSWSHIKKEHWEMFKIKYNTPLDRDSWTEVFINEPMYVSNVLYFALFRVQNSGFNNVKEFVITYDDQDFDIDFAMKYADIKIGTHIKFIKY
ncbi:MAG: helix-turn-helix transcriptional regulator [Coprobacillus cateniformis]|uniref:helix-turn-helix domain-containing protein n=1 Tax=Longibaculum muris TaxID=1796628 RepID=UPI003AB5CCF4|nr:helix-turn-helix transcriptional regulator [Coprobacillus cateniformis]